MSNFWDEVNNDLSALFGKGKAGSESGFPELGDLSSDPNDYTSPDAMKEAYALAGYRQPTRVNPNEVDQASIFSSIANRSSPFTVIDLTPIADGGTKNNVGGNPVQTVVPNTFPASQATLQLISTLLNVPVLSLFKNPNFVTGANPPGLTYVFEVTGNSLRTERLQQGLISAGSVGGAGISPFSTGLVSNDVYLQYALNLVLTGIFVQFDSTDNPIFILRHGETIKATFNKLYVTTFGSGGRWRLISGNNAVVEGISDDRQNRQNLHLWDSTGLMDNISTHPSPFSFDSTSSPTIFDNSDPGTGLTQQPSGNLVGTVINKGYCVFWITHITMTLAGVNPSAQLVKYRGKDGSSFPSRVYWNFAGAAGQTLEFSFSVPIRIVLAGSDLIRLVEGAPFITGEIAGFVLTGAGTRVWAQGYVMGGNHSSATTRCLVLIPANPYPQDVELFPT